MKTLTTLIILLVTFTVMFIGVGGIFNSFQDAQGDAVNQSIDLTGVIHSEAHNASGNITTAMYGASANFPLILAAIIIMVMLIAALVVYYQR